MQWCLNSIILKSCAVFLVINCMKTAALSVINCTDWLENFLCKRKVPAWYSYERPEYRRIYLRDSGGQRESERNYTLHTYCTHIRTHTKTYAHTKLQRHNWQNLILLFCAFFYSISCRKMKFNRMYFIKFS